MNSITIPKFLINRLQLFTGDAEMIIIIDSKFYYIGIKSFEHYSEIKELDTLLLSRTIKSIYFYSVIFIIFDNNSFILLGNDVQKNRINHLLTHTLNQNEFILNIGGDGFSYLYSYTNQNRLIDLSTGNTIECDDCWYGLYSLVIRRKEKYYYIYALHSLYDLIPFDDLTFNHHNIKKISFTNGYLLVLLVNNTILTYEIGFRFDNIESFSTEYISNIYSHYLDIYVLYRTSSNTIMIYNTLDNTHNILELDDNEEMTNQYLGGNSFIIKTSKNKLKLFGCECLGLNDFSSSFYNDIYRSLNNIYKLLLILCTKFTNGIPQIILEFTSYDSLLDITS